MRISELLSEGYVQRNGAAMKLGSLRLHFYPDHVFYVDGRLDLSIYRDGAFKPPRSNEVYLKDAARLGIPKDFFTIVSYWLNTPVQQQDALLPRIEAALNHIAEKHLSKKEDVDEALLSPRVHEIFLKGLVGAILSGGFSLGLDYAKEKTADLDKAGLQAVYKSIDPREYPELTKKLTPKDKAGLNAILGKLKEHTMKMEELIAEGPRGLNKGAKHDWAQNKTSQASKRGDGGWPKHYRQPGEPSKADLSAAAAKAKADWDKKKGIKEGNKENKAKKKVVLPPSQRPKNKVSTFDPRVDLKKKVAEDEYNGEGSFLKNELQTIARVAHHLANDLQDDENVPTWVISKISQSKGMLVGAMDYMISKHERGEQPMAEVKQRLDAKCWKGKHKEGTKIKGGVRVNNCVPNEKGE